MEAKKAEKLAKKEAIEAKKAEKVAKKEAMEAKKVAKKEAAEAKKEVVEVELESEEVNEFETMEVDGVEYIKQLDEDSGHIGLYHVETGEPVGIYNPETKLIEECEVEDSSDDEE